MGKKEKQKRETVQDDVHVENGGSESHQKRQKKKRKNREKVKEPGNDTVSLATEMSTVTIAIPGSIIDNAQSLELATRLAGQVARAATIFRIDEVVVFDSKSTSEDASPEIMENDSGENESGAVFLMRILRYLETPQYLRKSLFPKHNSLRVFCPHLMPHIICASMNGLHTEKASHWKNENKVLRGRLLMWVSARML